jgi:hypothetical protein
MKSERQIPIWFFIGLVLLIYGLLIMGTGLYHLFVPPEHKVALYKLHADLWWGAVITVLGGFYVLCFNPFRSKG